MLVTRMEIDKIFWRTDRGRENMERFVVESNVKIKGQENDLLSDEQTKEPHK